MNCKEALNLVHGYIDGELDLVKSLEIEQHLDACPACKVQYDQARELGSGIRAHAHYYAAPPALRTRIAANLPREPVSRARMWGWGGMGAREAVSGARMWGWGGMGAALALSTVLGLGLGLAFLQPGADERLGREVVAAHVRSLMADHLMDIASSDQHTVKPWIDGKLDFAPPVEDLAAQGYVLAGGRLDYLDGRGVMALVYRRHAHVINLFVWPQAPAADSGVRSDSGQGYNVAHFTRAGMAYWAVSDLNPQEFKAFVGLVRDRVASAR
jgi:anti-sigma factor RsiW